MTRGILMIFECDSMDQCVSVKLFHRYYDMDRTGNLTGLYYKWINVYFVPSSNGRIRLSKEGVLILMVILYRM